MDPFNDCGGPTGQANKPLLVPFYGIGPTPPKILELHNIVTASDHSIFPLPRKLDAPVPPIGAGMPANGQHGAAYHWSSSSTDRENSEFTASQLDHVGGTYRRVIARPSSAPDAIGGVYSAQDKRACWALPPSSRSCCH